MAIAIFASQGLVPHFRQQFWDLIDNGALTQESIEQEIERNPPPGAYPGMSIQAWIDLNVLASLAQWGSGTADLSLDTPTYIRDEMWRPFVPVSSAWQPDPTFWKPNDTDTMEALREYVVNAQVYTVGSTKPKTAPPPVDSTNPVGKLAFSAIVDGVKRDFYLQARLINTAAGTIITGTDGRKYELIFLTPMAAYWSPVLGS